MDPIARGSPHIVVDGLGEQLLPGSWHNCIYPAPAHGARVCAMCGRGSPRGLFAYLDRTMLVCMCSPGWRLSPRRTANHVPRVGTTSSHDAPVEALAPLEPPWLVRGRDTRDRHNSRRQHVGGTQRHETAPAPGSRLRARSCRRLQTQEERPRRRYQQWGSR